MAYVEPIDVRSVEPSCDNINVDITFISVKKKHTKEYTYLLTCEDLSDCLNTIDPVTCLADTILDKMANDYCKGAKDRYECILQYKERHYRDFIPPLRNWAELFLNLLCDAARYCKSINREDCDCLLAAYQCVTSDNKEECIEQNMKLPRDMKPPKVEKIEFEEWTTGRRFKTDKYHIKYTVRMSRGLMYPEIYLVARSPFTGIVIRRQITFEKAEELGLRVPDALGFREYIGRRLARRLGIKPGVYRFMSRNYAFEYIPETGRYFAVARSPLTNRLVRTEVTEEYVRTFTTERTITPGDYRGCIDRTVFEKLDKVCIEVDKWKPAVDEKEMELFNEIDEYFRWFVKERLMCYVAYD